MTASPIKIHRLRGTDIAMTRALNIMFGTAFEDAVAYDRAPPTDAYLKRILDRPDMIVLAALDGAQVVGGLVAHDLPKLEQARSEIYIYDLAVDLAFRRRGIATALIEETKRIGAALGAWVVMVQADYGDDPAIALYTKLGTREDVMHFDIAIDRCG
jgi:aminoglycoside 3-N-acetyltransferase I